MLEIEHKVRRDDNAVLQVVEYGADRNAPLVLLLPGNGGGIKRFAGIATSLCTFGFRCIAMNYRGAGKSTIGDSDGRTLHSYADDAAAVIRYFGQNATVLGNAFGNRVARCLAQDAPDLVSQIILVCAGGQVPPDRAVSKRMMDFANESLSREERMAAARETLFAPGSPIPDGFIEDNRTSLAAQLCMDAMKATQDSDWQAGGSAKMLIIQGKEDVIAVPENAELLKQRYPDRVTVQVIADAGHAVINEKPAEVANSIVDFLGRPGYGT